MYKNVLLAFWLFSHISNNNTPLTAEVCSCLLPAVFITAEKIDFFLFCSFFLFARFSRFSGGDAQHRTESNVLK